MIRTDKELLRDALDALDEIRAVETRDYWGLMDEIRTRLAEPEPEPEPVAWLMLGKDLGSDRNHVTIGKPECVPASPLYRYPPRQPVRLSDEEIRRVFLSNGFTIKHGHNDLKPYVFNAARAIEKAMLEKSR